MKNKKIGLTCEMELKLQGQLASILLRCLHGRVTIGPKSVVNCTRPVGCPIFLINN